MGGGGADAGILRPVLGTIFVNCTQVRAVWKEGTGTRKNASTCVTWHKHAPIYIFTPMGQERWLRS